MSFFIEILKYTNELDIKLLGKNQHIPDICSHIKYFEKKMTFFSFYGVVLKKKMKI